MFSIIIIIIIIIIIFLFFLLLFFFMGDPYSFWLLKTYYNNVQVIIYGDTNK